MNKAMVVKMIIGNSSPAFKYQNTDNNDKMANIEKVPSWQLSCSMLLCLPICYKFTEPVNVTASIQIPKVSQREVY